MTNSIAKQHMKGNKTNQIGDMEDPKKKFYKFVSMKQAILQKHIAKGTGVVEKIKTVKAPWCTKSFNKKVATE
eukprot:8979554-Lingulodinium_polyedra.AAC.1